MSRQTDVTPANCYLDATPTICTRLLWLNFEHVWVTNTYKMNQRTIICTGKWSMCHTFSISYSIPPAADFWPQHLAITKHANGIWRVHPSKGSHLGSYLGRYKHACIDSMHTIAVLHDVPHRAFCPKQLVSGPNFWRPPGCENGTW